MIKETFLEFCSNLYGYRFFSKKTGKEIPKYNIYWNGISSRKAIEIYNLKPRK